MDSSTRPPFCFSDNCHPRHCRQVCTEIKCPASDREELSEACILKDIDWDLRKQRRKGHTGEQVKGEKNLKGERKVSPRVFNQSIKVYFYPDLQSTPSSKMKHLS